MKIRILSTFRLVLALLPFFVAARVLAQSVNVLSAGTQGAAYSYTVTVAGTSFSATGLPPGLGINASTGLISGTPTEAGVYTGVITVVGALTDNYDYSLTVIAPVGTPVISAPASLSGTVGVAIAGTQVVAAPAATGYNAAGLPPGLTLNNVTGLITGTPTVAGAYTAVLSANNASGAGADKSVPITIAAAANTPVINSTLTATGAVNAAFTYTITATNTPTSFGARPLPNGLSLNSTTGVISGTPTVGGITDVAVTATNANGTSSVATVRITIGTLSSVTTLVGTGTLNSMYNLTLAASPVATSFNVVGTLPPGLTFDGVGTITGTPTATGVTNLTVSANNATGTGPTATLTITINQPSSGGGGGIIIPIPTGPTISTQPASQQAAAGGTVTFGVTATGANLTFQWSKDGKAISGATASTLTLGNVSSADVGSYTVVVANTGGSVTSSAATLTLIIPDESPVITTHPASQRIYVGGTATFTVVATGGSLSYQWRKDGKAIDGATNATLTLTNAAAGAAGDYGVVVSNSKGSTTSLNATLTVLPRAVGTYFGTLGGTSGSFSLFVRPDLSGVFLGYLRSGRIALVSQAVVIDASGHFRITIPAAPAATSAAAGDRVTAAATSDYVIDATVAADGSVSGEATISGAKLTIAAPAAAVTGPTLGYAGYYQAGVAGSSATSYIILGAAGDAYVVTVSGANTDAGKGTVDAAGKVAVTTENNATFSGSVQLPAITATSGATTYVGANNDQRADVERLFNVSTRSQTAGGGNVLIAGFVIKGGERKPVLVRAVGPTLGTFGVSGVLSAVHLDIYKGATLVASGNDWGSAANAGDITKAATQVGAFALPANSRDAALLLTLDEGAYTAVVTGQGGVTGVALIEAYDATTGAIPKAQRIVNLSTRAVAGTGDNTLIAGFCVTGSVPKRVLIRGAGPALAQAPYSLSGVLDKVQLAVYSGGKVIAQNTGWSTSPDAGAIATASAQVSGLVFAANSQDSALILNLAPGVYTAQVSGAGGTQGLALVEVYELP